jgi:AcrR family transcriptional regulator
MVKTPSKISGNRKSGKHQADELRTRILEAAEQLFLANGIETTSMADISARLGISRVTMYRYFANRDEIAVEIQIRMLEKINSVPPIDPDMPALDSYRAGVKQILRNYASLRDAYRYIGMFDAIYLDKAPDHAVTQWTRAQLWKGALGERAASGNLPQYKTYGYRLGIIFDTFTWYLEKLALRGEITWGGPAVAQEEHLAFFEQIILGSFDLLEKDPGKPEQSEPPNQKEETHDEHS